MSGISEYFKQKAAAPNAAKKPETKEHVNYAEKIANIKIQETTFGKYQKGYNRLDMNSSIFGARALESEKPVIESEGESAYGNLYFNGNRPVQNNTGLVDKMIMANDFRENHAQSLSSPNPSQAAAAVETQNSFTAHSAAAASSGSSGGGSSNPFA